MFTSLGGPGGAGRIGSRRTRDGSNEELDPLRNPLRNGVDVCGGAGVNRTSGAAADCRCWGVGGITSLGRIGRAGAGGVGAGPEGVPGGDHAGGGDLGRRCPGASAGLGSGNRPEVEIGGGGWGNLGGWGSGRDLPDERLERLIRK